MYIEGGRQVRENGEIAEGTLLPVPAPAPPAADTGKGKRRAGKNKK